MSRPKPSSGILAPSRWLLAGIVALAVAVSVVLLIWNAGRPPPIQPRVADKPVPEVPSAPTMDLENPPESYETFRNTVALGGDDRTREAAITWLDRVARESRVAPGEQESFLLTMLENGGNSSWSPGYRQHLFNSTFNALRRGGPNESLQRLLQKMAVGDSDRTLRLYALQHIGLERGSHRIKGELAEEIHHTLSNLAAEPDGEVAGLAVALLTAWNGNDASIPVDEKDLQVALDIAADPKRSPDNRVTAIHAAGPASLPLARRIAGDSSEPIFVRKAAVARIGFHGDATDFGLLEKLRGENSRLAQAAEPALRSVRDRLAHPSAPQLIPIR